MSGTKLPKRSKVNLDYRLDPSWGTLHPKAATIYRVAVSSILPGKPSWEFICLLPETETEHEALAVVTKVCEDFLEVGDHFEVYEFTNTDYKDFHDGMPLLGFNPNHPIDFCWLVPPPWLRQ